MAEQLIAAELDELKAYVAVDRLNKRLRAAEAIRDGKPDGLIHTLDRQPFGNLISGIDIYRDGIDNEEDVDVEATFADPQHEVHVIRKEGQNNTPTLHVLLEAAPRLMASTGYSTLKSLSRVTLALAGLGVEHVPGVRGSISIVADGKNAVKYDDARFETDEAVEAYDDMFETPAGHLVKGSPSALASSLREVVADEVKAASDALLVVSDLRGGTLRDKRGQLEGFDWEGPLKAAHDSLGDRLFVVQLTTLGHTEMPYTKTLSMNGQINRYDSDDFLTIADAQRRDGIAKSERIAKCLSGMRVLELSSDDPNPILDIADFIYGEPSDL